MSVSQIPFLLRLIDDPSPAVRDKVARALREFGPDLIDEIARSGVELSPSQQLALNPILSGENEEIAWRAQWTRWIADGDSDDNAARRLESALDLLSRWQLGADCAGRLSLWLDNWALEFNARNDVRDTDIEARAVDLSRFLFEEKVLAGASAEEFYDPLNSNALAAIESGSGLPITLSCIFILLGERVGVPLSGCNFPGHFMARVRHNGRDLLFDCFNGGRLLDPSEVAALRKVAPRELSSAPSATTVITRVLHNLINAYRQIDDEVRLQFVHNLLEELHHTRPLR